MQKKSKDQYPDCNEVVKEEDPALSCDLSFMSEMVSYKLSISQWEKYIGIYKGPRTISGIFYCTVAQVL